MITPIEHDHPKNPEEDTVSLTPGQIAALPMLAAGVKKQDVAAAAGVCPQTVSEWLRQSHFSSALQAKRNELISLAAERLSEATSAAVSTVLELMKSGHEATRLKAATLVLERVLGDPHLAVPSSAGQEREHDSAELEAVRLARAMISRLRRQEVFVDGQPNVPHFGLESP